ncbi:sodium- and chloride-dependent glycine transporter 1 isoform X1 [Patella vulgata]|uniref:sodium- and chloride-dependent glycine transporter 1 isoform X1 n=2 Tax=Patella vulgata TaxID=6465 RepID=UPI0021800436|nr:sodium- and chloride-dependent glycine transporter 1 isoform X1 [Patella vulgata]
MADSTQRGNWSNWCEFLLSCVGCMVGIGNIWRFPFVCYRSGGAAFLIPYFLAMAICGLPLVFLEMSYCQFSNLGPGKVWVICPLFKGIGVGMIVLTAVISCYYNVVLSWTLYYLSMSFSQTLPWSTCDQIWNTPNCIDAFGTRPLTNNSINSTLLVYNLSSGNMNGFVQEFTSNLTTSATEEYWKYHVLQESTGLETMGSIRWPLVGSLFAAWVCAFLCLIKGIKSSGKVVYVAATLPYFILLALLIRGCLLPGAVEGVKYYVIPRWEKLLESKVWQDAAVQVFYSAGIGWGGISTLASYNKFNNNCYRDAMILPVLDCLTSWFAGFVIFVYLGYMAHIENKSIDDVVTSGPGLTFVTYPHAVATMPLAQLWSVLFFVMLFLVGMDSQFVHIQTIITGISDASPTIGKNSKYKMVLTAGLCCVGFLFGLPFVTQGGIHLLNLIDNYIASISVMLLACFEVLVLSWCYGVDRLYGDISIMIGYRPTIIWKPLWMIISPAFIMVLWCFGIADLYKKVLESNTASWIVIIGVVIGVLPLLPVPTFAINTLNNMRGKSIKLKLLSSIKPSINWKSVAESCDTTKEEGELLHVPLKDIN